MTVKKLQIEEWKKLNDQIEVAMGSFDFDTIKKLRVEQRKLEDAMYEVLKGKVDKELPANCNEMEVGYENILQQLVYLDQVDDTTANAYFIDKNGNVEIVENFSVEDYE